MGFWIPAAAGMTKGKGGFETYPYEAVGVMGGGREMAPRIREGKGGITPIQTFPHQRGKSEEGRELGDNGGTVRRGLRVGSCLRRNKRGYGSEVLQLRCGQGDMWGWAGARGAGFKPAPTGECCRGWDSGFRLPPE